MEAAQPPTPHADHRAGRLAVSALLALIVPSTGWAVGVVLVFASRVWSRRDRVVGGLLLLAPIVLLGLGVSLAGPSGGEDSVPPSDSGAVGGEGRRAGRPWTYRARAFCGWSAERAIPGMAGAPGPGRQPAKIFRRMITC